MNELNEIEYYALPEKIVMANTHTEFLEKVFNHSRGTGGKAIFHYSKDVSVWMVEFDKLKESWKNKTVKINGVEYIREKYLGTESHPMHNGKPITVENVDGKTRLAVAIRKNGNTKTYNVLGVYTLDRKLSIDLNRLYKKIDLEDAKKLIPEAFI